jgi:uncharacterized protein YjbI with pentapeptide repeats
VSTLVLKVITMTALITAPNKVSTPSLKIIQVDSDQEYSKKDFSSCLIDNQNLRHTEFRTVDLTSTLFDDTELIFCAFVHATMQETTFINCDLTGTKFYSPEDCKINFINCQLTSVNIQELKKQEYYLENCWAYSSLNENARKVIRL